MLQNPTNFINYPFYTYYRKFFNVSNTLRFYPPIFVLPYFLLYVRLNRYYE